MDELRTLYVVDFMSYVSIIFRISRAKTGSLCFNVELNICR